MPAITSANVANAIVKLVAVDALPALVSNLVMGNLVNRDYEATLAKGGDTVNVAIPPTGMVVNDIAEGGNVLPQNPDAGNAQVVLNKHKEATFAIPDVTKVLAVPDLLKLYMQPAVVAIAEAIETDLLNLYPCFASSVGSAGVPITESVMDSAETTLFNNKVPASAQKYCVLSPTQYSAMRQIPRFSEWETAGEAGLRALIDGQVGKLKDIFFMRSQLVPMTGSDPVTTHNIAFARDAISLIMRRLPMPLPGTGAIAEYAEMGNFGIRVIMSYQPGSLSQQFTVDVLYGTAVMRQLFGVQVTT
jgi:hypothetical protein